MHLSQFDFALLASLASTSIAQFEVSFTIHARASDGAPGGPSIVGYLLDYLNELWTQFHATGAISALISSILVFMFDVSVDFSQFLVVDDDFLFANACFECNSVQLQFELFCDFVP
ncbi:hypothetical protein Scep_030570 [Stephania cephalantha]|uniref:Uncharacterized protein n=1 Tax=Stephania cephalantha TaxID=152367 RepID=A0AAP0E7I4_9MAGN